jgi:hypothetical protein
MLPMTVAEVYTSKSNVPRDMNVLAKVEKIKKSIRSQHNLHGASSKGKNDT